MGSTPPPAAAASNRAGHRSTDAAVAAPGADADVAAPGAGPSLVLALLADARKAVGNAKKAKFRLSKKTKDEDASSDGDDDDDEDNSAAPVKKKHKKEKRTKKKPRPEPTALVGGAMPTMRGCCMPVVKYKNGIIRFRMAPSRFSIAKDGKKDVKKEIEFALHDEQKTAWAWNQAKKYIDKNLK